MIDLSSTISTLLMIADSGSENWREQAKTAIHAYLAHNRRLPNVRDQLAEAFAKVNPGTERSNAIQDIIVLRHD